MHCRAEAYELLSRTLERIESPTGLLYGAVAISRHEHPGITPEDVDAQLQLIADRIRARVRSVSPRSLLTHAHAVLFDELDLRGNEDDFYSTDNSYVSAVLDTRRGLPIALCLIYKNVVERLGLDVTGVNSVGHFLASVHMDGRPTFVDPFNGGRVLTHGEAVSQLARNAGLGDETADIAPQRLREAIEASLLRPATHRQWLIRIVSNLEHIFYHDQHPNDLAAMLELRQLLATD